MRKARVFGDVLARARREQGFPNAHAFYKASGGRRTLGVLYANYLALERGRSLPKPERLPAILRALNLGEPSLQRRELVHAYLASLLGSDELLEGMRPGPVQSALSSEEVARQSIRQRSAQLEIAQWTALARDEAAYYAHVYLLNSPGWSQAREVAAAVRLPLPRVRAALKTLEAAKLAELSGERARSPLAYRFVRQLPHLPGTLGLKAAILKKREAFAGERGSLVQRTTLTTRVGKENLDRWFERLTESVRLLGAYGDAEKAHDTDVFYVDARVFKIFD